MLNGPVDDEEWDEDPADEQETREALLESSGRDFVPIRNEQKAPAVSRGPALFSLTTDLTYVRAVWL